MGLFAPSPLVLRDLRKFSFVDRSLAGQGKAWWLTCCLLDLGHLVGRIPAHRASRGPPSPFRLRDWRPRPAAGKSANRWCTRSKVLSYWSNRDRSGGRKAERRSRSPIPHRNGEGDHAKHGGRGCGPQTHRLVRISSVNAVAQGGRGRITPHAIALRGEGASVPTVALSRENEARAASVEFTAFRDHCHSVGRGGDSPPRRPHPRESPKPA